MLSVSIERKSSTHSRSGTATHKLAEDCLLTGQAALAYVHGRIKVEGEEFIVDADRAARAQLYVDTVRSLRDSLGAELLIEQRLDYGPAIGIDDPDSGWGTADTVLLTPDEIIVIDYKDGHEDVDVEGNTQLMLYGLGALRNYIDFLDPERVRLIIVQPRAGGVKEWVINADRLTEFAADASIAVDQCETAKLARGEAELMPYLKPGEKQCRWCPAAATCPALRNEVAARVLAITPATPEEFEDAKPVFNFEEFKQPDTYASSDVHWLAASLKVAPLVEHWLKAVRGATEALLLSGERVPGFKLVKGKQGNRAWADEAAAETMLRKTFRLKVEEAYDMKLISPTTAEKLLKEKKPRQWIKLGPLITRADGKLSVAPESDPRPAIDVKPVADDFADESASSEFA